MGRFGIQLLLEDNTWSTQYIIPELVNTVIRQRNGSC